MQYHSAVDKKAFIFKLNKIVLKRLQYAKR